jgi:hypothetical protein
MELKSVQICPDLSYFKKSRELETSLEKTFYQNLMHEIDETLLRENLMNTRTNLSQDDSIGGDSVDLFDNLNDNMSSMSQKNSDLESGSTAHFEEGLNINMISIGNNNNKDMNGFSYVDGFSSLKNDEIKVYLHQFGDGNKDAFKGLPNFNNFAKGFNQLDKMNNLKNPLKDGVKVKKVERLYEFSIDNEVNKNDVFLKDSKMKPAVNLKENYKKEKRRKVRQFFNYDKSMYNIFINW